MACVAVQQQIVEIERRDQATVALELDIAQGADLFHATADEQRVWVSDGTNARILQYDTSGRLLYWWGAYGTTPGQFWEMHQFSVDTDGNLYAADSFAGRTQKFAPNPGADRSKMVGGSIPLMPRSTR